MAETEDTTQNQFELTQEIADDLAQLIKDPKPEVKKQALAILIQCSSNPDNRILFQESDVISSLVKNIGDQRFTTICLSNLINFTQDGVFQKHLIDLKSTDRIVELIKNTITEVLKDNTGKKALNGDEHLSYTQPQKLVCDLCFLLLSNMTQHEEGKAGLLQLGDENKEGYNFRILYELYLKDTIQDLTRFFSNILTNISSDIEARKYLIRPENELPEKCLKYIFHQSRAKRVAILKAFRNCMFEYENKEYVARLFSENIKFVDTVAKYLANFLYAANHLNANEKDKQFLELIMSDYDMKKDAIKFTLDKEKVSRQQELEELLTALDLFLTLTNVDFNETNPNYQQKALQNLIAYMSGLNIGQDGREKVEVMQMVY
ncbi:hypothetical protein TTHERM_00706270 (macronuclear) [Tetrahymena thermophila SB210]|uniref:Protein HGH1 N-terminal domain-containing protein n=1 Tax=Tetrahymena thermophila (strain SB210) TaxID=312017 RepID=I7M0Q0_TETTS|nr:hypothetical protein TTHERM_00706270 [Tetrahymena thermophila SB210]EAR90712.1 hypothetical protein TTHERM_00706270 [Tetrahymena thermophila SB210]|eukprot:XP_001010957.1 hypothetical protein TTHERM_00706270 [Tetrahymena thermophila SB210]